MIRSDEQIKRDVVDELYWDSRVDASKIGVTVSDGVVSLTGTVPTYGDHSAARSAAWRMPGVTNVIENLTVTYVTPPSLPTDTDLKSRIANIFNWDPAIDATTVRASVVGGAVMLEGTVDSYWKRKHVEHSIIGLGGIHRIENKLAVVPSRTRADSVVAKDVVQAIERDSLVDVKDVTVAVNQGVVTLTGNVPTWSAVCAAEDDATYTRGVTNVRNRLRLAA